MTGTPVEDHTAKVGGAAPSQSEAPPSVIVGTAGWSLFRAEQDAFSSGGSGLSRYAARLDGTEINSTFRRRHRPSTFQRWADEVPEAFRFAVKLPKEITHDRRLAQTENLIDGFLADIAPLGGKQGPLLVQLPPSLSFDADLVSLFFSHLTSACAKPIVCEPRHPSWGTPEAEALLHSYRVARVGADPSPWAGGDHPGGFAGLIYLRLHGSPHMYRSAYSDAVLDTIAEILRVGRTVPSWCIFDNTASGAAIGDALKLRERVSEAAPLTEPSVG